MFGFYNLYLVLTKKILIVIFVITVIFSLNQCGSDSTHQTPLINESSGYLNHSDSAHYVGMNNCKLCHQSIYNTFIKTGMGKSLGLANRAKSSADFSSAKIHDSFNSLYYQAYWQTDSLYIHEYRLSKRDTTHSNRRQVNFIIGSGQHTNSHLSSVNGFLYQMPMTYYTQKRKWDFPPGFENGNNTRFTRKIGLECMTCHNAYPVFEMGSENKYLSVPLGIDCERCHGPGSIHVAQRSLGNHIDTSKYIDYSIVNPSKLSIDAQFDICQRCHLQGNAVLKENKSFYDFKPGQKLSDFISVFLPKYKNADKDFIMASHADRLKQSACFIKSYDKVKNNHSLKPYQEALTCVTCHNPHVSVRETNKEIFNQACQKCHSNTVKLVQKHKPVKMNSASDCVSCHMPVSGSTDIPHVSVHDHYIRKPVSQSEKEKIKIFLGLFSINESNPDALTKAKAYLNQYDKFEKQASYLDSAAFYLKSIEGTSAALSTVIQLYFTKQDYHKILQILKNKSESYCYENLFIHKSYENADAWASYRIGESFYFTNNLKQALKWFRRSISLAPDNLDFRNKTGTTLAALNMNTEAKKEFEKIISQNPYYVSAYSNLGYLEMIDGHPELSYKLYQKGLKAEPNNEPLLLNLAAYYLYIKDFSNAKKTLLRVLSINNNNVQAIQILKQIDNKI